MKLERWPRPTVEYPLGWRERWTSILYALPGTERKYLSYVWDGKSVFDLKHSFFCPGVFSLLSSVTASAEKCIKRFWEITVKEEFEEGIVLSEGSLYIEEGGGEGGWGGEGKKGGGGEE